MKASKKKNPVYSQSKAKQFELWTKGKSFETFLRTVCCAELA